MAISYGMKKGKEIKNLKVKLTKILPFGKKESSDSNSYQMKIQPWTYAKEIRAKLAHKYGLSNKYIRLYYNNIELVDNLSMMDYCIIEKKNAEIFYEIDDSKRNFCIKVYGTFPCPKICEKIIEKAISGFIGGLKPQLIEDGTSGTYKIRDADREVIGIFKPFDEEPFAPNNQKGYASNFGSESFRRGIRSGEATIREVAAFLLDKKNRFDIPPTTFIEVSHPSFTNNNEFITGKIEDDRIMKGGMIQRFLFENLKGNKGNDGNIEHYYKSEKYNYIPKKYGSLQKFVKSTGIAADYSSSLYTVEEAHKIMILDLRILNCDRNDENILLIKKPKKVNKKDFYKLIPIDHALSFPDCLKIYDYELCWMTWKQAEVPFTEEEKNYISSIDILEDMERIDKVIKLREECWKYFRISNTVLKVCASYDLTPCEIGSLMYQFDYDKETPSKIELIISKTDNLCSDIEQSKSLRIFSFNGRDIEEKKNNKNKKFKRKFSKRRSLLQRTTSAPKDYKRDDEDEEEDEYSGLKPGIENKDKMKAKKKSSRKSSIGDDIIFDSPFNELYFQNFTVFLEELIKKEFPEKAEKYNKLKKEEEQKNNLYEYELKISSGEDEDLKESEESDD